MAVKLRLARYGAKKYAYYRIVAADARARRDGRFLEQIGTYNPNHKPESVTLRADRIAHWLSVGAQPTDTVKNLFKRHLNADGTAKVVVPAPAVVATPKPAAAKTAAAPKAAPAPVAEAPAAEAAQAPPAAEAPVVPAVEAPVVPAVEAPAAEASAEPVAE